LRPLIRERTAGNPFFIEEVVQSLVEDGSLVGDHAAYQLRRSPDRLKVPSSVQTLIAARIDRLGAREKTVLQNAAAIGRRFADSLLRAVCELPAGELDEALAALRRAEMAHEEALYPEIEYAFRHPLIHEVAGESQLSDARASVHAKIALALEESSADRLEENAALLAHHWDEAAEPEAAARWHRRAAEHIAGSNSRAAQRHWERVRELSAGLDDEELARELGQQSRLMILEYGWRSGSPDEANALLEEGEAWARSHDDMHALASIYNAFAIPCAFSLGEVWRARDMAREGLRLAEQVGDEVLAFALELRVFYSVAPIGVVADMRDAIEAANRRSVGVMDAASHLVGFDARAAAVGFHAWPICYAGKLRPALKQVQRGLAIARENASPETTGWLLSIETEIRAALGESPLAPGRESYEIAQQIDSNLSRVAAVTYLAPALVEAGDAGAAASLLEHVLPLASASAKHMEPEAFCRLAAARCALADLTGAREAAQRALALSKERRLFRGEVYARTGLAMVGIEDGGPAQLEEARAELERAKTMAMEIGQLVLLPQLCELRARLAERQGDALARETALGEALALYEGMEAPRQVERIEGLLGG
jgi:adenylate cyclase